MASPPFNINQAIPGDTDVVSQHPSNARTFRDVTESWLLLVSDTMGRLVLAKGNTATRDALTNKVDGTLFILSDVTPFVIQRWNGASWDTLGTAQATETVAGVLEVATQAETDAGALDTRIVTPAKLNAFAPGMASVTADPYNDKGVIVDASDAAKWKVAPLTGMAMRTVQTVAATPVTAFSDLTNTIPNDDTAPTSTEGDQLLTASITAGNAANLFEITVTISASGNANGQGLVSIFKDGTNVQTFVMALTAGNIATETFHHRAAAGDVAAHTFTVRVGGATGQLANMYINGNSGGRKFGGALAATMVIHEIRA